MTAARKRKTQAEAVDFGTRERRLKGDIRITDAPAKADRRARAESSVERIANQKGVDGNPKLTAAQVEAAKRFYTLAVIYGEMGRVASMDFSKEVFGGSQDDTSGAWIEDQKRRYLAAHRLISKRYSAPMIQIIVYDATLTEAGQLVGYRGKDAGAPMLPILQDTLDRLAAFFGLVGDKSNAP